MDFVSWFTQHGGYLNPATEITRSDDGGQTLRIKEDLALSPGETAVSCPHHLTLSMNNVRETRKSMGMAPLLDTSSLRRIVALRLCVVDEYLLGDKSFWGPYIRNLPQPTDKHAFCTPQYFSEEDRVWLAGTNLGEALDERINMWRLEFKDAQEKLSDIEGVQQKQWTWDLYIWAATIITSRTFPAAASSKSDLGLPVLVPGLDFLNHSMRARVTWDWSSDRCAIITDTRLAGGQEVLNNYGPKSNEELLMGYGFCLDPNVADTFNLRYSSAFVRQISSDQRHESVPNGQDSSEALSEQAKSRASPMSQRIDNDSSTGPLHYVKLIPDVNSDAGEMNYRFSPGFVNDFALVLRNDRERKDTRQEAPEAVVSFSASSLSRNKLQVLSALIMILQGRRGNIRIHDPQLQHSPEGPRQKYAAIYRASQLNIVETVLDSLTETFLSITSTPPLHDTRLTDGQMPDLSPPVPNFVVRLEDILTSSTGSSSQSSENEVLKKTLRAVVHAGLGTRDPKRIRRKGADEFPFAIWLCCLWLMNPAETGSLVPTKGESESPDTNASPSPQKTGSGTSIYRWLNKLRKWYPCPITPSNTATNDDDDADQQEIHSIATSYLDAIRVASTKHPEILFARTDLKALVTEERLMWCLVVIRGEGVRCPAVGIREAEGPGEGNGKGKGERAEKRFLENFRIDEKGGEGDEFLVVVEVV